MFSLFVIFSWWESWYSKFIRSIEFKILIKKLHFGATKICIPGNRNLLTYFAVKQVLNEEFGGGVKFFFIDLRRHLQKKKKRF